jgi:quercetin dioxygenase-like cupin family protein
MNGGNARSLPGSGLVAALLVMVAVVGGLTLSARLSSAQSHAKSSPGESHAAAPFSHSLPPMDGSHLRAIVVEVKYAPGEKDEPHSHPCPVIGYVAQGTIRFQVKRRTRNRL